MKKHFLSAGVAADLENIWDYIALDSTEAADRWIRRLFEMFEALARTPGMGHRRRDASDLDVLFWAVDRYLIIYRRVLDDIEIVAVTQGSRDLPALLRLRL